MKFCAGCGQEWVDNGSTCFHCGCDTSLTYENHNCPTPVADVTSIEVQGEKGRKIGEVIGGVIAPGKPGVRIALGVAGRFIGRRLAKGHPFFAVGVDPEFIPEHRKPPKKRRKPRKKSTTKALAKRPRKAKKP